MAGTLPPKAVLHSVVALLKDNASSRSPLALAHEAPNSASASSLFMTPMRFVHVDEQCEIVVIL